MNDLLIYPAPQKWFPDEGTCHITFEEGTFGVPSFAAPDELSALKRKLDELFCRVTLQSSKLLYSLVAGTPSASAPTFPKNRCDCYELTIRPAGIALFAPSAAGFFYGLTTLCHLRRSYDALPCGTVSDWADTPLRAEYIDLRSLFPRKELFASYLREMSENKVNAVVIEFENRRPFRAFSDLTDEQFAFTADELADLAACARENFIDLIPLQQCFGHLEYALTRPAFKPLRETPDAVGELCPLKEGSQKLVFTLLDEMAELFPDAAYLHLGCDEVWSLGEGSESKASGKSRIDLFIDYVNSLIDHVCALGKRPLIWHDMLKDATAEELGRLDPRVTVILWVYGSFRNLDAMRPLMERLRAQKISFWAASSVRCWEDGDGLQVFPFADARFRNVDAWTPYMKEFAIPGMISTNWAVPFAQGGPYGLYETSRFICAYADEAGWNRAHAAEPFISRYLRDAHGIADCENYSLLLPSEYYKLAEEFLRLASRRQDKLALFVLLSRYESLTRQGGPLQTVLYRLEEHSDAADERIALRYRKMKEGLAAFREPLRESLLLFLPEKMADEYLRSRYYLPELYMKTARESLGQIS